MKSVIEKFISIISGYRPGVIYTHDRHKNIHAYSQQIQQNNLNLKCYFKERCYTHGRPARWGFTTTDDQHRIEAVVRRGVRAGLYLADGPAAAQLIEDYDNTLFSRLMKTESA